LTVENVVWHLVPLSIGPAKHVNGKQDQSKIGNSNRPGAGGKNPERRAGGEVSD